MCDSPFSFFPSHGNCRGGLVLTLGHPKITAARITEPLLGRWLCEGGIYTSCVKLLRFLELFVIAAQPNLSCPTYSLSLRCPSSGIITHIAHVCGEDLIRECVKLLAQCWLMGRAHEMLDSCPLWQGSAFLTKADKPT